MTTELENQFFDTFVIEPRLDCKKCGAKNFALGQCWEVNCEKSYPQITDRILLELIRLGLNCDFVIHSKSVEELKEKLLALLIYNEAEFKHQVQALFKE